MLTTVRCTLSTASTTAVRRESLLAWTKADSGPSTAATKVRLIASFPSTPSLRLIKVVGTALVLFAIETGCTQVDRISVTQARGSFVLRHRSRLGFGSVYPVSQLEPTHRDVP